MSERTAKVADEPKSLGYETLCECDPQTIAQQIGQRTRMEIGCRDYVGMPDGLMFSYGPRSRKKYRKIIIKLNGADLYEVEAGYMDRTTLEYHVVARESDIFAESLAESVRRVVAKGLDA